VPKKERTLIHSIYSDEEYNDIFSIHKNCGSYSLQAFKEYIIMEVLLRQEGNNCNFDKLGTITDDLSSVEVQLYYTYY
jgi:hypothetical protein